MGMLDRYKKTGGFVQLLTLLETSGKQKQQKFLEIIRQEDPRWADALTSKMIDLDRVLGWDRSALSEITGSMLEINLASILHTLSDEQREKVLSSMSSIQKRKVLDAFEGSNGNPGEIAVSVGKLLETIRRLVQDGKLRFEKLDPELRIDADIESKLKQGAPIAGVPENLTSSADLKRELSSSPGLNVVTSLDAKAWSASIQDKLSADAEAELNSLRKKVIQLHAENKSLRHELATAQNKLEQIRKIA